MLLPRVLETKWLKNPQVQNAGGEGERWEQGKKRKERIGSVLVTLCPAFPGRGYERALI